VLPMWLVGGLFRRQVLGLIPWEVEKNLRRLSVSWTEAMEKAEGDLRAQATAWVEAELATLDRLLSQQPAEANVFRQALQRLEGMAVQSPRD